MSHERALLAEPATFADSLNDWMQRAPWLAISAAAHVLIVLILLAIPWELLRRDETHVVQAQLTAPPEEQFDESQPEDPPEFLDETLPTDEPVLQNNEIADVVDDPSEEPSDTEGDPMFTSDSPFDRFGDNALIGIGGDAGGKYGSRFAGDGRRGGTGGGGTEQPLADGLAWLAAHQSSDGSWDSDGFAANCGKLGPSTCDGSGEATHDVGMTGLALLAFLGDGHTTSTGRYREVVARGIAWLRAQQDPDTGLFGEKIGHAFLYDHAIATLAVCEAYYFSHSPLLQRCAQDAANFISTARNPYAAWRYDVPPSGDNDTSVTGWCVFALKSAQEAGLVVDPQAFVGALGWLDEATDPASGRCGYDSIGSASSRIERVNDHFPPEKGEAMTAVALLCCFFLGQDPAHTEVMGRHAALLSAKPPRWDPDAHGVDFYYWYYGSYAMYQMGGSKHWEPWNRAMKSAIVGSQRRDGDAKGSWDPQVDPWGFAGGRVYSTALGVLCLEVYFRYSRVLGAR